MGPRNEGLHTVVMPKGSVGLIEYLSTYISGFDFNIYAVPKAEEIRRGISKKPFYHSGYVLELKKTKKSFQYTGEELKVVLHESQNPPVLTFVPEWKD